MKRTKAIFAAWGLVALMAACVQKETEKPLPEPTSEGKLNREQLLEGDSTIYGLACEGCNDSVVILLPGDGSDPVTYNIIDAHRHNRVMGRLKVGDWIGLIRNPTDSTVADFVLNLDELKGTWCYVVMPTWRDATNMTPQAQAILEESMPDSVKKEFFVPREYGFSLKRQWTAQSVGYVRKSPLEDQSPVVYPRLLYFTEWHILNCRLVMTSREYQKKDDSEEMELAGYRNDTCDVVFLSGDSLVLASDGESRGYYRRTNVADINKEARQKAAEQQKRALQER
ncbi:MAG: hypothetical protein IJQ48_03630 [Prevotella sp.]|nr:hypothetical protein [Prevotella sp.]MBR0269086.1 hypothetical protein [Prevotella sp.]